MRNALMHCPKVVLRHQNQMVFLLASDHVGLKDKQSPLEDDSSKATEDIWINGRAVLGGRCRPTLLHIRAQAVAIGIVETQMSLLGCLHDAEHPGSVHPNV